MACTDHIHTTPIWVRLRGKSAVGLRIWGGSGGDLSVTSTESSLPLFKAESKHSENTCR